MAWCLTIQEANKLRDAFKEGKINPEELAKMSSGERRAFFQKFTSEQNAIKINSLFESKLLLKNQQQGMVTWAKRTLGMNKQTQRDLMTRIERLSEQDILTSQTLQTFKEDLVRTRLGLNVSFEEAQAINDLAQKRIEARSEWEKVINENPHWADAHNTRKEWINNSKRIEYGLTQVALEKYVNDIKVESRRIRFTEFPVKATIKAVQEIPGILKSLMASIDNSFFGRQGIKNLYGGVVQKTIWTGAFAKSFNDVQMDIRAKKVDGFDAMDLIRADIYSRPNSMNKKYKAGGYRLDVLAEEAFPTSLPEKIPGFGRLFKASETAFSGAALRMRADLADWHISKMEAQGINTLDPEQARGVGHMIGSLTGRGSLGKLEPLAGEINVLLFSGRFLKSNLDTLTAHQFDPRATPYVKKEARKNLLSILAHILGILTIAKILASDSVELDPRNTNWGRIKIFGQWVDITGGMRSLITAVARIVPTRRNGEWGFWAQSSSGKWTNLRSGEFGQRDAMDIVMDLILFNRLSPIASVIHEYWRGEMFGGEPFNIKKAIVESTTPLSIQETIQASEEGFTAAMVALLGEFVGFGVSSYKYQSFWEKSTSQEMINFKEQVGEEKFKKANEDFNRVYNLWLVEVEKDPKYKKLSDDGKDKLKADARSAIKEKILKEYGYRKKKTRKTQTEREEERIRKTLEP